MASNGDMLGGAITDILLSSLGIPTLSKARKLIGKIEERTEVIVALRKGSKVSEEGLAFIKRLIGENEHVKVIPVYAKDWPGDRPDPLVIIGGRLGGRYKFYGLPTEILAPVFLTAIAAAGGTWKPKSCQGLDAASGRVILYVVPGLPCAKAMYYVLQVVYCSEKAEIEIANLETMLLQGMQLPVKRVPAFVTPKGTLYQGLPRDVQGVAKLWET